MRPGDHRLRNAIQTITHRPRPDQTSPTDEQWGQWIEQRLSRLESRQKWLLTLSIATLAAVAGVNPELLADIVRRTLQALP